MNLGTLYYERSALDEAAECLAAPPRSIPRTRWRITTSAARSKHRASLKKRAATCARPSRSMNPTPIRTTNLAFVCEKLGDDAEARRHWQRYVDLDPAGFWSSQARQHLTTVTPFRPIRKS